MVNGSGLDISTAGDIAKFSVFLKDTYLYPSPVELESLQVQILHESDNEIIHPSIHLKGSGNGKFQAFSPLWIFFRFLIQTLLQVAYYLKTWITEILIQNRLLPLHWPV